MCQQIYFIKKSKIYCKLYFKEKFFIFFYTKCLTYLEDVDIIYFVVRCGSIAQLGEHLPYKQGVTGSSPVVPIDDCGSIAQLGEHLPYKQGVTGSSPVVPTLFLIFS